LQTDTVFLNVSKGEEAGKELLKKCFKTDDENKIRLEILKKGELQVSEKERNQQISLTFKEIATIVSEQTVDPNTNKPYPTTLIETCMKDKHYSVKPGKTAKQQAMEVIKLLQESMPIERAQMKISVTFPVSFKQAKDIISQRVVQVIETDVGADVEMVSYIYVSSFFFHLLLLLMLLLVLSHLLLLL